MLFTSRRQLEAVLAGIATVISHHRLVQDQLSKNALLMEHRRNIDKGEPSAIFGLASFFEGIDLPGDYCRHVVIAKLPFAVPDDPIFLGSRGITRCTGSGIPSWKSMSRMPHRS